MGRTLLGLAAILVASVLVTWLTGRFTVLHLAAWIVWNLSMFWIFLFGRGRRRKARCRP